MTAVRMAAAEDIGGISALLARSWKTAYRGMVDDEYLDSLREEHWVNFLMAELSSGAVFSVILMEDEEIIGASILEESEAKGAVHLISFYLRPDKIGKGLGHLFYDALEREMVGRGFTGCTLDVLKNNQRAIRFYHAHGFVDTNAPITALLGKKSYACRVLKKKF